MSSRSLCLLLLLLPAWGHSSTITLMGVPEYQWFHGCSPTAGGMLFGYWDSKPGYGNLFDGDASTWWGNDDGSTGTKRMVASQEFITGTSHPLNCIAGRRIVLAGHFRRYEALRILGRSGDVD